MGLFIFAWAHISGIVILGAAFCLLEKTPYGALNNNEKFVNNTHMNSTKILKNPVYINQTSTVAGPMETKGPLGSYFDVAMEDNFWGEKTWEKAESKMQQVAVRELLMKTAKKAEDIDILLAGDLLNQCAGSHFGLREFGIPFYGQFGACSTMAQTLALSALLIDGGAAEIAIAGTSSHFYSAERQFRTPIEYGGQRAPTAQWTVTGAGSALVSKENGVKINAVTVGKIVDWGVTDSGDMGSAMAPAAADTLREHFVNTGTSASKYTKILTGDLGGFGGSILKDLLQLGENYVDCGCMIYGHDKEKGSGGSGCGCSALVMCGEIIPKMMSGSIRGKVLFVGTGALLNATSPLQGESIPSIAHLVELEA